MRSVHENSLILSTKIRLTCPREFCHPQVTVAVWTPKKFFPLLTRPQGSQGCQKIRFFFLQMKMFSFCAKIAPRRHKLQKTIKIEEKMSNKPCFLGLFWIFLNLGAILAQQTSTGMFSGSRRIFWHPWDLWERINSGDTRVLRFDLIFFVTVAPPGGFFTFMEMLPNVSFIIKTIKKGVFVSTNSHNFIVFRQRHPLKA